MKHEILDESGRIPDDTVLENYEPKEDISTDEQIIEAYSLDAWIPDIRIKYLKVRDLEQMGKICCYCHKRMTEEELEKEVVGVKAKRFPTKKKYGAVSCDDCMANIASGN